MRLLFFIGITFISLGGYSQAIPNKETIFIIPGGIFTWVSGIGVFYPDGTKTQRTGVKIDKTVKPTVEGIRAGKDELLEEAMQIINAKTAGK